MKDKRTIGAIAVLLLVAWFVASLSREREADESLQNVEVPAIMAELEVYLNEKGCKQTARVSKIGRYCEDAIVGVAITECAQEPKTYIAWRDDAVQRYRGKNSICDLRLRLTDD